MSDQKRELTSADKHLLRLIRKGKDDEGWSKVSGLLWPLVVTLPRELVELKPGDAGGYIRLTDSGETVLDWL